MKQNKLLASIFLIVFIDLLGFSLILPILPFYAIRFQATDFMIGLLTASYAVAQFIAAPFLGRLSDRFGRRPILLISITGSIIGFIILALAPNLMWLFIARILAGFTGGNISVAQAYIADVTKPEERAKGLGLIGAAFGLGFIFGPALGGMLSSWLTSAPAFLAALLSSINLLMVIFWLPESLTAERRQELAHTTRPPFTLGAMLSALSRKTVGPLLYTRFFFGVAFTMFTSIFALWGLHQLNLNEQQTGYILAYIGLLSAIVQGVGVGILAKRFRDQHLILAAVILMTMGLLGWAFTTTIPMLLIILIPVALGGGVLNTIINAALSKSVEPVDVGAILGLSSSLESLTRVISPLLGTYLLQSLGNRSPGLASTALLVLLAVYVLRYVVLPESLPLSNNQAV